MPGISTTGFGSCPSRSAMAVAWSMREMPKTALSARCAASAMMASPSVMFAAVRPSSIPRSGFGTLSTALPAANESPSAAGQVRAPRAPVVTFEKSIRVCRCSTGPVTSSVASRKRRSATSNCRRPCFRIWAMSSTPLGSQFDIA